MSRELPDVIAFCSEAEPWTPGWPPLKHRRETLMSTDVGMFPFPSSFCPISSDLLGSTQDQRGKDQGGFVVLVLLFAYGPGWIREHAELFDVKSTTMFTSPSHIRAAIVLEQRGDLWQLSPLCPCRLLLFIRPQPLLWGKTGSIDHWGHQVYSLFLLLFHSLLSFA